jgi:DNA-binding transcriptional MerR regulator
VQVEDEAKQLKEIKDAIAENDQQQIEARSEAAAQRMLLEEDAELRKAIQEEERAKLEKESEAVLEEKLNAERYVKPVHCQLPYIAFISSLSAGKN